ncbi:MAG TPA: c-type cytochrome [Gammaproteobacteria bacterium]|nr:c-type cytochrome [Gammaproteobacteria bacterium]
MGYTTKRIKKCRKIGLTLLLSFFANAFLCQSVAAASETEAIQQRIRPYGVVHTQGKTSESSAANNTGNGAHAKNQYEQYCAMCHNFSVAGAPKFRDKASWAPFLEKGKAAIVEKAMGGAGSMPPKGSCTACSKEELEAIIEYMMPH